MTKEMIPPRITESTEEWGAKQDPPVTISRVCQRCRAEEIQLNGKIAAWKIGRDWRIHPDAKALPDRRVDSKHSRKAKTPPNA